MKQIPNLFTLLNLVFGCMAIVYGMEYGLDVYQNDEGNIIARLPEAIWLSSVCIAVAAVIDFLDGFVARLLKASSEMGKQLDSLADVVSFGVAPGIIVYQFLRLSFAQQENGLQVSMLALLPAFLLPMAGAYRLGRFNIDQSPSTGFKGVPIPAAGLLIASFPLIYWMNNKAWVFDLLKNYWFWYAVILFISALMVSELPMLALKFKQVSLKGLLPFILVALISGSAAFLMGWLAVPIGFLAYVTISLLFKQKTQL
jgi:CDP-diacylglycerol---serine O-phosphatidyltransferase